MLRGKRSHEIKLIGIDKWSHLINTIKTGKRSLFTQLLLTLWLWPCLTIAQTVNIAAGEYPPWLSKDLPGGGFIAQLISESFEHSGYQAKIKFLPWKRGYDRAKAGNYAASAYWYPSKKREEHFIYSDAINKETTHFFYNKDTPLKQWDKLADLSDFKIGATDGYTYTDEFWKAARSGVINVELANRDELNMAKLIRGRIDLFPVEKHLGYSLITTHFQPHMAYLIDFHPKPLIKTTGHLLFSKAHPENTTLVKAFNSGLKELKESGRYEELLKTMVMRRPSSIQ